MTKAKSNSTTAKKTAAPRATTPEKMVRVFHPALPSFEDVPASRVEEWVAQGWKKTAPRDVKLDVDSLPPVGEHPGIPQVPVLESTSRTTRSTTGSRAAGSTTTRSAGSGSSGTASTPSGSAAGTV